MRVLACSIFIVVLYGCALAGEPADDKDLQIMRLQKIIAEQTMARLLENTTVAEYERIRRNYRALIEKIAERERELQSSSTSSGTGKQ